jgi:sigma-B regulation protein RsbU (phosphoserine phosphatase)
MKSNMFVNFFLRYRSSQRNVELCNAGHNPPVLIRENGDCRFFNLTKAIPLGLFDNYAYTDKTSGSKRAIRYFLYTRRPDRSRRCRQQVVW